MIDSMLMLKTRAASETPSAVRTIKDLRFSRFRGMTLIPPGFSRRQGPKPDPFELGAIRSARGGAVACYRIPVFRQQKPGGKRQRGGAIHFVPWSKPTRVGQFWFFHVPSFPQAGPDCYPCGLQTDPLIRRFISS